MSMSYSVDALYKQLEALGAPQDTVVHVHASLRSVGQLEARGATVLEALIRYFTETGGLLTLPTHTWKNLRDLSQPTLDLASSETCVGMLPNLAAAHPDAQRSLHPTHSMAVFDGTAEGERAQAFAALDEGTNTSTHPEGCYGELYRRGGCIILLGVGHNRNTFLHCVEEMLDVPNRLSRELIPATIRLLSGELIPRPIHCHQAEGIADVSANFPKFEAAFRHHGVIRDGRLGDAPVQICDARGMTEVMELILQRAQGRELLADDTPLDPVLWL